MAEYQILSWHEIPAQIRVRDGQERVQIELPPHFQERIDEEAMKRGLVGSDAYLDGWKWGEKMERDGSAKEVAEAIQRELEEKFPP
jgi:hypothetical protein